MVCDDMSEQRQCAVIRTSADGTKVLEELPEGTAEAAAFVIVAAASEHEGASREGSLLFGQPVFLRHAASGRYLCAGAGDPASGAVRPAPAELSRENLRLSLLPMALCRGSARAGGSALPLGHVQGDCVFRFVPTTNHGRGEVFTEDPLLLVTDAKRLVRAALPPPDSKDGAALDALGRVERTADAAAMVAAAHAGNSTEGNSAGTGGRGRSDIHACCPSFPDLPVRRRTSVRGPSSQEQGSLTPPSNPAASIPAGPVSPALPPTRLQRISSIQSGGQSSALGSTFSGARQRSFTNAETSELIPFDE